jgi:ribosomal protein L12E/L44/L45/RPP1/RPP2
VGRKTLISLSITTGQRHAVGHKIAEKEEEEKEKEEEEEEEEEVVMVMEEGLRVLR